MRDESIGIEGTQNLAAGALDFPESVSMVFFLRVIARCIQI